jgi:hypothetical protein
MTYVHDFAPGVCSRVGSNSIIYYGNSNNLRFLLLLPITSIRENGRGEKLVGHPKGQISILKLA